MAPEVNIAQIKRAANSNIPLTIKTYTMPHDTEIYIEKVLQNFLSEIGHDDIFNPISYCVKELAVNAKKANTKRVYFSEKKLDINRTNEYEEGMKNFKEETLSNIDHYLKLQKENGLFIKVVFRTKAKEFVISVHNNVEITKKEQMRAYDRIARSRAFESIEEAFSAVLDSSEGAGLGIVIMVLMLKKIGLVEDAFELDVVDGETVATLTIPYSDIRVEKINLLAKTLVKEVNSLPQFPENLIYLQKLIGDPEADIHDIARQVSTDIALTADLIRLVNSALYMLPKKIDSIVEAVKLVGMRGLRNLIYTYGSQKIFEKKYSEMRELWRHSYRVAFYAYNLAKTFRMKNDILDDSFVGGILHDLGKIIVNALHPDLLEKIKKFCIEKGIPEKMLEDFSVGLNHAEIGAMIATKWNFPEQLVSSIRWHHEPTGCEEGFAEVSYIVYLANYIAYMEKGELQFDQLDKAVLERFRIGSEGQLRKMTERLQQNFSEENLPGLGR
ncbi:MAG TPA: HDOD domain-containing protein [Spirochaetia bacterium]|nr:HDOD domain-containing protein [Spirochaetia bacterium]